jgi:acyl-CoA reductase-like NAD-dependent aldehyde dehydrogenase
MIPERILNWINGEEVPAESGEWLEKYDPHTGDLQSHAARSREVDISAAVEAGKRAQPAWADTPPVQRGLILHRIVRLMQDYQQDIGDIVAAETGKGPTAGYGETGGAIQCGLFYASEGQRLYGKTTTSGVENKYAMTVRMPVGVAGLIIAANTPIANVAWKVFPALICGNAAVLKAAEDTPATAWMFGKIAKEAGLPNGVLNIVQGYGPEAGQPLVEHPDVDVISFTGSTSVGKLVQRLAADRLAKVSLELGGKNPLVVCDDADLDNAARWVLLSAFSNAGQRCAAGSRIIIFVSVYDEFVEMLIERSRQLRMGNTDNDDLGPVINERQLENMLEAVKIAKGEGARILYGGERATQPDLASGYYMQPTLMDNVEPKAEISCTELFGPIAILYRVAGFDEALALANDSPYGLTSCIHTRSIHRAMRFTEKVYTGVAVVNAATYGSEPHMPFGGTRSSGNGSREPGTEALDVYSELKDIYINTLPEHL